MSDLERLRELLSRATPGPWNIQAYYTNAGTPDEIVRGMIVNDDDYCIGIIDEKDAPVGQDSLSYDLDLIVEMHRALPTLQSENAVKDARIKELEEGLEHICAEADRVRQLGPSDSYRDGLIEGLSWARSTARSLLEKEG